MKITFLTFYAGFGVLTNLALLGPIDWSSWVTWAVLLLWPAVWVVSLFIIVFVFYLLVIFVVWIAESLGQISFIRAWNKRRNDRRIRKFLRKARA